MSIQLKRIFDPFVWPWSALNRLVVKESKIKDTKVIAKTIRREPWEKHFLQNKEEVMAQRGLAEGRGFEPPVGLPLLLISSQMPLTTQPPFPPVRQIRNAL